MYRRREESEVGEYTVGVEEEYQLISVADAELRSQALDVLDIDWSGDLHPESQQTMLEVGTRVCSSRAELDGELRRLRLQVASAAAAEGLATVAAGVHPFSRWENQSPTPGERYQIVLERFGRVLRTEQIFGMHTHVAVPSGVDRARVLNAVRHYIPHLLALSASSPVYEGEDTGYASYRTILAQRLPHSGPPPRFPSERGYREWVGRLLGAGLLEDERTLYWSVRPHPKYPTVEFRTTDVCPRVDDAVAIASLCRALVAAAVEGLLPGPAAFCSGSAADEVLAGEEWQAARFGLRGTLIHGESASGGIPIRDAVRRLLERLAPVAEALGDSRSLDGIETILERGNGSDRIRERLVDSPGLQDLVGWLAGETLLGVGMDRRTAQRSQQARPGHGAG